MAGAVQASTQVYLKGTETWAELPGNCARPEWAHAARPVCRRLRALYGHMESCGYWARRSEERLRSVGF